VSDRIVVRENVQDVQLTAVRLHAWALRSWLYARFILAEGVPVPSVYAAPMDAFAEFNRLWQFDGGPYGYLKQFLNPNVPDAPQVWPQNIPTPLISFVDTGARYKPQLSYATRTNRRSAWLSNSNAEQGMQQNYLGEVQQVQYAQAYDFSFQVDMWTQRPDVQAVLEEQLYAAFSHTAAGEVQAWIPVLYPVTHGRQNVRLRLTSDVSKVIETMAPPAEGIVMRRSSFTVAIEGYRPDRTTVIVPTVWFMSLNLSADNPSPGDLQSLYALNQYDLRADPQNPIVALRQATMPPPGGSYTGSGSYAGSLIP
jgi:hypothetical protein